MKYDSSFTLIAAAGACALAASAWAGRQETFAGCGVIQMWPQGCLVFQAFDGPSFAVDPFIDGGVGDFFSVGATYFIAGQVTPASSLCAPASIPQLSLTVVTQCVDECGTLAIGPQGCTLFEGDSGTTYVIGDTQGFRPGDHVHVEAGFVIDAPCVPTIFQPTLIVGTVELCQLPEDLDGDGDVDGLDLALLLGAWGICFIDIGCPADLNDDGAINGLDLAILLAAWG